MKNRKKFYLLMIVITYILQLSAVWEDPYMTPAEMKKLEEKIAEKELLRKRKLVEKCIAHPLTKLTGNALITKLLTESDSEKTAKLDQLPLEVREHLLDLIENKKSLLDENEPIEKEQIEEFDTLKVFIRQNINATVAEIQELQEQKKD